MRIELIKETKFGEDQPWYCIYLDGKYIKGGFDGAVVSDIYHRIVEDAKIIETKKEILKSEEIGVSLSNIKIQ